MIIIASGKYKNLNNEAYWEQRSLEKEDKYFALAEKLNAELKKAYSSNLKKIQKELAYFYSKYSTDGVLSYADAMKYNRLDSLMKSIKDLLFKMTGQEQLSIDSLLTNIYTSNYYETIFDIQKGINLGFNFAKINEKAIKTIVNEPWSGKNYSKRIWTRRDKLVKKVKQTLTNGFIRGESNQKMAKNLNDVVNGGYKNAVRLIRTETTHVANQSTISAYKECDVEQYRFIATYDLRTSTICKSLNNKIFDVADAQSGVNLPSMHPNCRSCTVGYWGDDIVQRIARDKNGKNITIDGKMSYEEWYNKYAK